jgi:hypothetical protein
MPVIGARTRDRTGRDCRHGADALWRFRPSERPVLICGSASAGQELRRRNLGPDATAASGLTVISPERQGHVAGDFGGSARPPKKPAATSLASIEPGEPWRLSRPVTFAPGSQTCRWAARWTTRRSATRSRRRGVGPAARPAPGRVGRRSRARAERVGDRGGRWRIQEYHCTVGTPIVALAGPDAERFLWRADAQGIVDPSARGTSRQDIRNAVQKMFADLPTKLCWPPQRARPQRRSGKSQTYAIRATTGRTVRGGESDDHQP